jgi:hypothetical protein
VLITKKQVSLCRVHNNQLNANYCHGSAKTLKWAQINRMALLKKIGVPKTG